MCMGRATKKLSFYMEQVKEYTGTIRLGEATSTMDAESKVEEVKEWKHLTGVQGDSPVLSNVKMVMVSVRIWYLPRET